MFMEFKNEDMLDLNEQNIKKIFKTCLATKETKDPVKSDFLLEKSKVPMPPPRLPTTLLPVVAIHYLLGQLHSVHAEHEKLLLLDGFKKYDGTNWTTDKSTLFMLYYLGTSVGAIPLFKPLLERRTFTSSIHGQLHLKATLSPNDPNFKRKVGQEPADD